MNIFVLDMNHKRNAKYHCDKHIIKMITEYNQLLCNALHMNNCKEVPYKLTHKNHPCAVWVRSSEENFQWLIKLCKELCKEYTYRYKKIHKGEEVLERIKRIKIKLPRIGLTEFAQAVPEDVKSDNAVNAYRELYRKHKQHLHSWKGRSVPEWL